MCCFLLAHVRNEEIFCLRRCGIQRSISRVVHQQGFAIVGTASGDPVPHLAVS